MSGGRHHSSPCCLTLLQALHLLCSKLGTRACTLDAALTAELNDKTTFSELCESLGVLVPKSFPITSKQSLYELNGRCGPPLLHTHRQAPLSDAFLLRGALGQELRGKTGPAD